MVPPDAAELRTPPTRGSACCGASRVALSRRSKPMFCTRRTHRPLAHEFGYGPADMLEKSLDWPDGKVGSPCAGRERLVRPRSVFCNACGQCGERITVRRRRQRKIYVHPPRQASTPVPLLYEKPQSHSFFAGSWSWNSEFHNIEMFSVLKDGR